MHDPNVASKLFHAFRSLLKYHQKWQPEYVEFFTTNAPDMLGSDLLTLVAEYLDVDASIESIKNLPDRYRVVELSPKASKIVWMIQTGIPPWR